MRPIALADLHRYQPSPSMPAWIGRQVSALLEQRDRLVQGAYANERVLAHCSAQEHGASVSARCRRQWHQCCQTRRGLRIPLSSDSVRAAVVPAFWERWSVGRPTSASHERRDDRSIKWSRTSADQSTTRRLSDIDITKLGFYGISWARRTHLVCLRGNTSQGGCASIWRALHSRARSIPGTSRRTRADADGERQTGFPLPYETNQKILFAALGTHRRQEWWSTRAATGIRSRGRTCSAKSSRGSTTISGPSNRNHR